MTKQTINSTTQTFLDIHDITHDTVLMKDGSASIILSVDAMNFGLLAEEEQDGVMYAYAGLLNSLNYTIQVVIKSQTKDVTNYLRLLKSQEEKTANEIMAERIGRYRDFVANLIQERNVLDKKFYVVIPASAIELGLITPQSLLPGKSGDFDITSVEKNIIIEKANNILEPRGDHLISQFARIGLYATKLATQEIIQLFYVSYNPEAAEGQEITDSKSYTSPLVTADVEENFMANTNPSQTNQPIGQTTAPQAEVSASQQPVVGQSANQSAANQQPTITPSTAPSIANAAENPLPTVPQPTPQPAAQAPIVNEPNTTITSPIVAPVAPTPPTTPVSPTTLVPPVTDETKPLSELKKSVNSTVSVEPNALDKSNDSIITPKDLDSSKEKDIQEEINNAAKGFVPENTGSTPPIQSIKTSLSTDQESSSLNPSLSPSSTTPTPPPIPEL